MIAIQDLSFSYEGTPRRSLDGVSMHVERGELVVLAGESGCGKTTLTRCLNGLIPQFYPGLLRGRIRINGDDIAGRPLHDIGRRVASVFQDPRSQFFTTRTTAEVAFACENFGFDTAEVRARVDGAFDDLDITALRDQSVFELSSGERQKIAVASAYALRPEVVVLDEPSANLDIAATRDLAAALDTLRRRGVTIVVAEHRLFYLAHLLDRLVYMRDGRIEDTFDRDALRRLDAASLIARGLRQVDLREVRMAPRDQPSREAILLQMREVQFAYPRKPRAVDGLTLHASPGEIVGIAGDNGSGKTTAAKLAVGLLTPQAGRVRFAYRVSRAKERLAHAFFVMQDADYQLYAESVLDELLLGRETTPDEARRTLDALGLASLADRHPQTLSGGQKQRLTIAVGLASRAGLICLDEPTSGLDAISMVRVGDAVRALAASGKAVCVITHDYELIAAVCQRAVRMDAGRVVSESLVEPGCERDVLARVVDPRLLESAGDPLRVAV